MYYSAASGVLRRIYACFYLTWLGLSISVDARQTLVSRAIIRPIPISGFKVSVFNDITGAPIPQVPASDGGGLIGGMVFSTPNLLWAISAVVIGVPLGVAGVRLWRITIALGGGLTLALAMWVALVNAISESGLASSQSMSDMLILLLTGAAFFGGLIGGAIRLVVLPAMAATCALGGSSIAVRAVILRPGLLVPPGQNRRLAFVNILIVVVGALSGALSVIFKRRESMIFSTSCIGSFLFALAADLLANGQDGMSRGLRFLFDMNDNHVADLVGGGYNPPLSSQIMVASSLGLGLILCIIQHFTFPGPFQQPRPRDRTESTIELGLASEKTNSSTFFQAAVDRTHIAPGPTWRNSVLSLFRVPGRASSGSSRQMTGLGGPLPGKPSNERCESDAYSYSQASCPNLQHPSPTAIPGRFPQFTGIGPQSNQDHNQFLAARINHQSHNIHRPSIAPIRYGSAQRGPPLRMGTFVRPGNPRHTAAQSAASLRARGDSNTSPALHIPRFPPPKTIPPSGTAILTSPPSADDVTASTPRLWIGMGMLRMSINSIIDGYGGTTDANYRSGVSRTGEEGRI
ncbi:unnamed protein product [Rhizoctonia solani]|uniref:TM7S3/TM198-like domain-containing protein n=1 Tax=Rhizoctonia solani TaxID=456999 RepID=A0A8H2XBK3_9AGAM|nr:unnamed protein product [Rhizoctonia solani]